MKSVQFYFYGLINIINLTPNQLIISIIGAISLIPTFVLFRQYLKTRIADFFIFSGIFLSVSIAAFSQIFVTGENFLIFIQIHKWALNTTYFLFFLHGARILWTRTPTIVWSIGVSWFGILIFLPLFFEVMPQQETAFVLFTEMPAVPSSYHPLGAGIETANGVVLYSSSHNFLDTIFLIFSVVILLYSYIKMELPFQTQKMRRTKKLWLIVWSLIFLYGILLVPWVYNFLRFESTTLLNILPLIGEIISALIAIFIPESMLMTQTQLVRASDLYEKVKKMKTHEEIQEFGMESLVNYLKSIPKAQMAEIVAEREKDVSSGR